VVIKEREWVGRGVRYERGGYRTAEKRQITQKGQDRQQHDVKGEVSKDYR
jgi:hypothetical protein